MFDDHFPREIYLLGNELSDRCKEEENDERKLTELFSLHVHQEENYSNVYDRRDLI